MSIKMAGDDKFNGKADNCEDKSDKSTENVECHLNLSLDEAFSDTIEYVPCPEFHFTTSACYICNGYYGPCFEEPVCATCHAFLFPDDIGLPQVPIFSEKTDDEDSGNDEPTDLYYATDRRSSSQRTSAPRNIPPDVPNVTKSVPNVGSNVPPTPRASCASNAARMYSWGSPSSRDEDFPRGRRCSPNSRIPKDASLGEENFHDSAHAPWSCRNSDGNEASSSSRPHHLDERVEMLTNHKHQEHEPINEPGLVERLPPEVLLAVFSYLDNVSLWSAANVCRRWYGLLLTHVPSQQWQQHVKIHWPLYRPIGNVDNWYKVYDKMASSAPCRVCFNLMCLRAEPSRMEENSWRRNRLRSELKSLRIDPPEGIEATPLDQKCCHWQATITGPIGSPYEGGLFYLYLQVPYSSLDNSAKTKRSANAHVRRTTVFFSYPMCPPVVKFLTKILHPNVSRHGDVGIDSIHHNWSLALTISKVLISVQSLLTDPYCQVCMEPELGEMYMNDRERFEEVARAWTWKYAMHDVVTPT